MSEHEIFINCESNEEAFENNTQSTNENQKLLNDS